MILTTPNFDEKLSKLDQSLQTEINKFQNSLETVEGGDSLDTVLEFKIKEAKIYYSLSKNKEGKIDVNFIDIGVVN